MKLSEIDRKIAFSKLKIIRENLHKLAGIFFNGDAYNLVLKIQNINEEVFRIEKKIRYKKKYKNKEWLYEWYRGKWYWGGGEGFDPDHGKSAKWLARRAKCSVSTIYRYLKKFGILTNRQYEEETKYGI